jgi:hypothetical protein
LEIAVSKTFEPSSSAVGAATRRVSVCRSDLFGALQNIFVFADNRVGHCFEFFFGDNTVTNEFLSIKMRTPGCALTRAYITGCV